MRIRTKILLPVAILLSITAVSVSLVVSRSFLTASTSQAEVTETLLLQSLHDEVSATLEGVRRSVDDTERQALQQASLFSRLPNVVEAYRVAATGDMRDERSDASQRARESIREFIGPFQEGSVAATGSPTQIHFHLPTANSLVRTWRDGYQLTRNGERLDISDDLSGFRQTVIDINQGDHKPITGIEVGKGGLVIRGLMPVQDQTGNHLGSVESFFDFVPVIEKARTSDDLFFSIYMKSELLEIAVAFQEEAEYPRLEGEFVLLAATDRERTFTEIPLDFVERAASGEHISQEGAVILGGMPIADYQGQSVGALVAYRDASGMIAEIDESTEAAVASGRRLGVLIAAAIFVVIVVIITIIVVLTTRMLKPLDTVAQVADEIAAGKLSVKVPDERRSDEIGKLLGSFSNMTGSLVAKGERLRAYAEGDLTRATEMASDSDELGQSINKLWTSLREILSEAGEVSEEVSSGSSHISDASQQLASGANEQAASVEEISSSLDVVAGQARQNAETSEQAHKVAQETVGNSKQGVEKVEHLTKLMEDITAGSAETQKVVKAIDDIAFQINLLALNANVEAARAGKYGKGFAVVAEEVRNLATRSADAVKETTEIVQRSIESIGQGAHATEETVAQFRRIAEQTDRITTMLSEVAAASANQSGAIQEITAGLSQIDQVTQTNSATAEESASAAEELAQLARRLESIMGRFHLGAAATSRLPISDSRSRGEEELSETEYRSQGAPLATR
ncbi:MAG: methyl-accepting chemotaxis protein [Spirochaetales bacterium]